MKRERVESTHLVHHHAIMKMLQVIIRSEKLKVNGQFKGPQGSKVKGRSSCASSLGGKDTQRKIATNI